MTNSQLSACAIVVICFGFLLAVALTITDSNDFYNRIWECRGQLSSVTGQLRDCQANQVPSKP